MAPSLAAMCTILCAIGSTAFVAPQVSLGRGIRAQRCATPRVRSRIIPLRMGGDDSEILSKVQSIVVEQLAVDESKVIPTASFTGDLGADSLDTVELIMALEEGFDIEIEDEKAADITTVQDAVNYISEAQA